MESVGEEVEDAGIDRQVSGLARELDADRAGTGRREEDLINEVIICEDCSTKWTHSGGGGANGGRAPIGDRRFREVGR